MINSKLTSDLSLLEINKYLKLKLLGKQGDNAAAIHAEFKEWIIRDDELDLDEVWSIPDLTDEGLSDFFLRAISQSTS